MPLRERKIADLQDEIAAAIQAAGDMVDRLPPSLRGLGLLVPRQGLILKVRLRGKNRRKKENACADSWDPREGTVEISYEESDVRGTVSWSAATPSDHAANPLPSGDVNHQSIDNLRLDDVVRILDAVEHRRDLDFVGLKRFRDEIFPGSGVGWASDPGVVREVIDRAIKVGCIATGKAPNPKNPQFPTTTIRLNRSHPTVAATLRRTSDRSDAFKPIQIRGEPLSRTILRERR